MGRNNYLTRGNIDFYLNLVKGIKREFTEDEKKCLEDFEKHGVVEKRGNSYKPMIPVFTEEVFSELENFNEHHDPGNGSPQKGRHKLQTL